MDGVVDQLVARFGPLSARAARIPMLLDEKPHDLAGLVGETGLSRRCCRSSTRVGTATPTAWTPYQTTSRPTCGRGRHQSTPSTSPRSEERRVGKECRSRWAADH